MSAPPYPDPRAVHLHVGREPPDGISFGVQLEMNEVQLGMVAPPADMGMACP